MKEKKYMKAAIINIRYTKAPLIGPDQRGLIFS